MNKLEKIQKIITYKDDIDKRIHDNYHKLVQKYNLTLEQFHLLVELDELMLDICNENDAPTVGSIAKNINNSQNTVSEKISRLENRRLVKRVKDSKDRRISRVMLTEEGRKVIKAMDQEASGKFMLDAVSNMEESDVDALLDSLSKLINSMDRIG
ncbi:MarR family winged helix-turn-helix transcriptional regulator [Clostridium oryzae]|uniref:Transcriptional activatory protein BadR n=1 Tax=Clostridium oryzae TaxID=1450648 RepID=A0A1V4IUG9_9CLOT|nr:MarR family transcriptional regulator [Clostridium oryzae]OPJ63087.1 transcriptional activatory protein BadR [Clostridium oryzae]